MTVTVTVTVTVASIGMSDRWLFEPEQSISLFSFAYNIIYSNNETSHKLDYNSKHIKEIQIGRGVTIALAITVEKLWVRSPLPIPNYDPGIYIFTTFFVASIDDLNPWWSIVIRDLTHVVMDVFERRYIC